MSISGISSSDPLLESIDSSSTSSTDDSDSLYSILTDSSDDSDSDDIYSILESEAESALEISEQATRLCSLSKLAASNSTAFKSASASISSDLYGAASNASGIDALELKTLAAVFSNASLTGSLTGLSTSGSSNSLKGYSSSSSTNLVKAYLSASEDSNITSTINTILSDVVGSAT